MDFSIVNHNDFLMLAGVEKSIRYRSLKDGKAIATRTRAGVTVQTTSISVPWLESRSPIAHRYANHGTLIEVVWTVTPALVLVAIA
jgi:hypothetical protein